MSLVIRRALAHRSPEELLLIPVVLLIGLAILAQPTAITRLFDTPFATPIPGDSPADVFMKGRTPAPAPSPVTRDTSETVESGETVIYDRSGTVILGRIPDRPVIGASDCPRGLALREISVAFQPGAPVQTLRACVDADGSVITWDGNTGQRMRSMLIPGSVAGR